MSKEDVYATNNKIVVISASTVAIILALMTIVFLVLLARRKRQESARDERSESLPSIKGRSFSCVSDTSSYGNSRGEPPQRLVTIQHGLDPHIEVDNEEETEQAGEDGTDNLSPTNPTIMSDSLSSAGQYHFSFRDLEFADNATDEIGIVNLAGPNEKVEESGNGNRGGQNNLREITEVLSSDSDESCDDSDDDTTIETTVEA